MYHLPVVFGTLFFALGYLFTVYGSLAVYQSWLWLVVGREGQIGYTPLKNNTLTYNPLSDKQYLYPLNLSPSYRIAKDSV